MARTTKASIIPALGLLAVLFMVLPQGGGDVEVDMIFGREGWTFEPVAVEADPGARIAFTNDTDVTHTATCVGCPWDSGDIQPGETVFLTFDEAQANQFFCRYHGASQGMTGVLTVGDAPPPTPPQPPAGP